MKRSVLILFAVLAVSWSVAAQNDDWELTEILDIPQAEFTFRYPAGYTLTAAEEGHLIPPGWEPIPNASVFMEAPTEIERAYVMTERESDVDAAMDADRDTIAVGTVISLYSSPLADWSVDETQSVEEMSRAVCDILGFSTFQRTPVAIMGRMGIVCEGIGMTTRRSEIIAVWTDDGTVFVLNIETSGPRTIPDEDEDLYALLDTFRSTPVAPLDRDVELGETGYILSVPSEWTVERTDYGFALSEPVDDPGDGMQFAFAVLSESLMRANDAELETTDDAIGFMMSAFDFESPEFAEVIVAGELTLEVSGLASDEGAYARATAYMLEEDLMSFLQFARDAESLERYEATFHAILASVRRTADEPEEEE